MPTKHMKTLNCKNFKKKSDLKHMLFSIYQIQDIGRTVLEMWCDISRSLENLIKISILLIVISCKKTGM